MMNNLKIMKHLILTFIVVLLCVNIAFAQKETSIKPASVYKLDGITLVSPEQAGWMLLKSDKAETVFEKREKDAISSVSVKTIKTKTFDTDSERLIGFEALKTEELSNIKMTRDSVHFNYVRFKGLMCLQYDGIFKPDETPAPGFKNFNFRGYLCPSVNAKDSALQIEFDNYSNTRGLTEDLNTVAAEFFEKITFPKAAAN
jgi:hypothetical protein